MMSMTHMAFGLLFFSIVGSLMGAQLDGIILVSVFVGSLLPDIDHPRSVIGSVFFPISRWLHSNYGHRTITHSAQFVLMSCSSFIVYPFVGIVTPLALVLGVISHLIADGMNVSGVPLQYPNTRPFYFLPKGLLVKTGSTGEFAYFIVFLISAGVATGMNQIGFRSTFHLLFPSYNGVFDEFCKQCTGDGQKHECRVEAYICAQYHCGPVQGEIMGIWGKDLVVRAKPFEYYYLDEFNVKSIKLDVIDDVTIYYEEHYFKDENLSFDYSAYSVSGKLYGKFECAQCRDYYPAMLFNKNKLEFNWFAIEDLKELDIQGHVDFGNIRYLDKTKN